jgi:5-methylcytosine-specific restriction endonuclease McrA
MAKSVVNLDALIPRQDMLSPAAEFRGATLERIDIGHLDDAFFVNALRKPDFQRETAHWSPEKVVDLVRAFVSGDLIPAVILWRRGANVFVIDGAHRLSALISWVKDDYGAGKQSLEHFGGRVPDEQHKIAERTRKLINATVVPYVQLAGAKRNPQNAAPDIQTMLGHLAVNAIVAQWVPQVDEKAAEESFFKINQAATPIDPTERIILRSRYIPNAIAARAIVRGGTGHKYWAGFPLAAQSQIESQAKAIHAALYEPPLGEQPLKTLDVPVAGRGYSALPFVYELVNWANNVPDQSKSKTELVRDSDGSTTIAYLKEVGDAVALITGTEMKSLGLHPIVYFYTRGGDFQPSAFIAASAFIRDLVQKRQLNKFTKVRARFEDFVLAHKEFVTLIIKKTGAGKRSLGRIVRYLDLLMNQLSAGKEDRQVLATMQADSEFSFLVAAIKTPSIRDGENVTRRFSRATKSASFLETATKGAVKCAICGALLHRNSMQFDHATDARKGGGADMSNAQPTHPYCNSAKAALAKL